MRRYERIENKRNEYINEVAKYLKELILDISDKLNISIKYISNLGNTVLPVDDYYKMVVVNDVIDNNGYIVYTGVIYIPVDINNEAIVYLIKSSEEHKYIYVNASIVNKKIEPILKVKASINDIEVVMYVVMDRARSTILDIAYKI